MRHLQILQYQPNDYLIQTPNPQFRQWQFVYMKIYFSGINRKEHVSKGEGTWPHASDGDRRECRCISGCRPHNSGPLLQQVLTQVHQWMHQRQATPTASRKGDPRHCGQGNHLFNIMTWVCSWACWERSLYVRADWCWHNILVEKAIKREREILRMNTELRH